VNAGRRLVVPIAFSLWTIAVGGVVLLAPDSPVRPLVVLPFVLVAPGIALVRLLALRDPVLELTLACAVGIALATLVGSVMAYAGSWLPDLGLAVLMSIMLAAIAGDFLQVRTATRAEEEAG
jgi:uncharacterized membrane protein